jgi:hypothetical protein
MLAGGDDLVGIGGGEFDVEHVDIGEAFKEDAFALHHRLARQCSDIAQAQHRGPVGDDAHQVAFGGVFVSEAGVALDFQARNGYSGSIGKTKIALGAAWLGRGYGHLACRRCGMVFQSIFWADFHDNDPFTANYIRIS